MARTDQVGSHKTVISVDPTSKYYGPLKRITYHNTVVVAFDNKKIMLNTGGWKTPTTKLRMNQAANQFGLDYRVYQENFQWYADFKGRQIPFNGNSLALKR
jgi:hypothetical protein